ncbi:hypothetical protein DRJ22_05645 [Candidatus Woesearchaeota archaeon]|nr:MAG: hypothetical protein DRJ22_05645 [Candidatus Woesearchaeota archaeon]
MSAVVRDDLAEEISKSVDDPERTLAEGLMVDIDYDLRLSAVGSPGGWQDSADVNGLKVMSGHFPDDLAVAVDHCDVVGPAAGQDDPEFLGCGAFAIDSSAVEMSAGLIDFLGLKDPSDAAVVIQHCIAGHYFIASVAVEVYRAGLVCRAIAAGVGNAPEQVALAVVGPDSMVSVFDEDIRRTVAAGQIAEYEAIACIIGDFDSSALFAGTPVQLDDGAFRAEDDFILAVAVPVVDLACDVVVPVLSSGTGVAPPPEDRAVELLCNGCAGVMHIAFVHVFATDNFRLPVPVEVARDDPLPAVVAL